VEECKGKSEDNFRSLKEEEVPDAEDCFFGHVVGEKASEPLKGNHGGVEGKAICEVRY